MKQNPFSFYDFLGYMLPGAVLLYIITFVFGVDDIVAKLSLEDASSSTANQLLSFIPAVIFSYLLGHVLAIGSSALIEAFTNYSNGYPSEFLFGVKPKAYLSSDTISGQFGRVVLWLLILPISVFKLVLKDILKIKMFNQAKALPQPLREATHNKCTAVLSQHIDVDTSNMKLEKGIDGDYLRLLYHFIFENSERHSAKLQNYVALYGLTRNVSFAFIVLFWWSVYSYFFTSQFSVGKIHIVSFATLAYVFYIGFVKFYRRYSLEAVMAASVFSKKDG
ncbi:hypothetical protein A1OK_15390 [Enterovibrio norvegicus FF-454]|uniref:Uncharacterized protein n=1 Tax=Enterovibrio norvegicus FF-454 TaxID=1185651 RepID=A0A1E5BYP0_9GAMM|nr:hypothetical protein [Enterovibrio norvegicus]OEE58378.1 hypothetical protein A1OK_15390 [Enterovibrio norvegicus FF-454]